MNILQDIHRFIHSKAICSPEILWELENISSQVLKTLEQKPLEQYKDVLQKPRELDWNGVFFYFCNYFEKIIEKQSISKNIQGFIKKRYKYNTGQNIIPNYEWKKIFAIAYLDIYTCVLLHIYFDIPKEKLIGFILFSMIKWWAAHDNMISSIVYTSILQNTTPELPWKIIQNLKSSISDKKKIHSLWEPSCPFQKSTEGKKWVEEVWNICEKQTLPFMKKQFQSNSMKWEKFFSWNFKNTSNS